MSTGQQIGLIGSSVRVQSLPTASAATFGEGNRFYTLIGQQDGYITGHTYRTVMANDVYSWEDVRNELMLLALVDGTITANSSIEVALSNFNRQPLVDNLLIVYSNANQYALMKVSAVTSTAATLIVKDNSAANIVSTKGETGAAGVGITNATAGEPIVADEKTTTPITFSFSDGTTKEFNIEAQNGTDGAQGVGVKSITSGTPTVVNDKTNTPILITLTDNTTVGLVVSAENGKDGTSATVDIVQATGQSTTSVMSQKAVTDELNKKANTSDIPIKTSQLTNDSDYATKSYVDTQDNKKLDKAGGSVTGNLTIGGNLIVNGATTSIDSTTLKVSDKLIEVAKDNTAKLTTPAGIVVPKYDGTNYGALVIDSDGNAQVGDVKLDSSGNIDVTNSDLQILATREGLTDGNLVKWDGTKKTLVPDTTVASNASSALSKANANATEISTIKTTYQTKTDNTLGTTSKTVVGAINEVKGTADGANSKASVNATEISNIKNGTTVVKNADHANTASNASNATNVTTNINGHAITDIFETNGTTVKEATRAGKATSADKATQANSASKVAKSLTFSGQNAQGTESTIGFDGSQAQKVDFNGDDFVATKGNAFEVSLAPSGVTAYTYNNVTVDEKGRVTAGLNKDYATTAQVNAKYTKPESGIPKSDLAEDVKTSLGKADTALQSAPVTAVNGKTGDVTLGASDVGALPTSTKYVVSVNGESGEVKNIAKTNSANTFTGDQTVTGNGSVSGNFTVGGNLTINGTTTTVDSTTLQVKDKLIEVAHGNTTTLTTPAGLVAPKYDGENSGALVFDSTGTAYVGDVKFDSTGNIDVANSGLQPLATRTGLVGGNLVQYDSSALTLKDSGKKIDDLVTTNTTQTISGSKTFTAQPIINASNGLKFTKGNCVLRIYNTGASPTDYAAIEVRSTSSTKRNLFIDLDINSLVVGQASGTADTTYKVNVKDSFNATTIYENGTPLTNKYLGKTAKAADADKLDGKDSTYYLDYNNLDNTPPNATTSTPGLMSASDKTKLDGIATGAKGTITGINMNGASKGTSGVVDLGTVLTDASQFATSAQGTKADNAMPKSGGTFTGEVTFGSTENFQGYYIKRMIGSLSAGTEYKNLDSSYKDGTWHRMWRLRFPSGSNFWGKIKITLYGGYSSFNASGVMSKSITCNFNTSTIFNNVGCYDGLGVNVEQDFRISEAIWNATVSAWEVLIWQKNLKGNNSPTIMLECWTTNNTKYIKAFNGITAQTVELTQSTSYSAQKASPTGGTKTVEWATLPVYENPLGEEIATVAMLPTYSLSGTTLTITL